MEFPVTGSCGPEVKYPHMRAEVKYALAAFGDEEYQARVWTTEAPAEVDYAYDFDMACHAILDDTDVLTRPASLLGVVVRDETELSALIALAEALRAVIAEVGAGATFARARDSLAWPEVVRRAREASAIFGRPERFP